MGHYTVKNISHQKGQSYLAEVQYEYIYMKYRRPELNPQLVWQLFSLETEAIGFLFILTFQYIYSCFNCCAPWWGVTRHLPHCWQQIQMASYSCWHWIARQTQHELLLPFKYTSCKRCWFPEKRNTIFTGTQINHTSCLFSPSSLPPHPPFLPLLLILTYTHKSTIKVNIKK